MSIIWENDVYVQNRVKANIRLPMSSWNLGRITSLNGARLTRLRKTATQNVRVMRNCSMATITGKVGTTSETAFLTVNPAVLESLTLNPTTVAGGQPSTGTVTVKGVAPPSGLVIQLTSSKGSAAVPAKVTIPGGKTSATFTVKTTTVATQNSATITATSNGVTESASLTINPIGVLSLKLNPTSVTGGKSSTATVQLSGAAPTGGIIVTLASSGSFASIPATVTVAAGKTTATFTVKTTTVQATSTASISATLAGGSASATLTVK